MKKIVADSTANLRVYRSRLVDKRSAAVRARTLVGMTISSFVSIGFAAIVGIAACTPSAAAEDKAQTAKCTDRTNNISCGSCCKTEDAALVNNVCTCKGKPIP